jgi:hypothetical protein
MKLLTRSAGRNLRSKVSRGLKQEERSAEILNRLEVEKVHFNYHRVPWLLVWWNSSMRYGVMNQYYLVRTQSQFSVRFLSKVLLAIPSPASPSYTVM